MTAPASPSAASFSSERRRSRRAPHVVEAFLSSPTGGIRMEVTSIDLSRHGVRVAVAKPVAAGTFQVLELGLGPQKMVSEVHILSCRTEKDGTFHVHAEFC